MGRMRLGSVLLESGAPVQWAEAGRLPDPVIRLGIRGMLAVTSRRARRAAAGLESFIADLDARPIAEATDVANKQHYELPPAYFDLVLGPRRKYSATIWASPDTSLAASEAAMLALTAERAGIRDGDRVLELGCGWGSFTLWAAEHFPNSQIVGVSNSHSQRSHIQALARRAGLANVQVITADMNDFSPQGQFDRVVSIEMFEHLKNYRALLSRIAGWLRPGGTLFVHIFSHRTGAYHFTKGWMAEHFFTGGTMPSDELLLHVADDFTLTGHWRINGRHYARTLREWLHRHDANREQVESIFVGVYGSPEAARTWFGRWRLFYMGCEELFSFRGGQEWMVSQYRFQRS